MRQNKQLAVLAAADERVATHHITKFRAAGGTDVGLGAAFDFAARDRAQRLAPSPPHLDARGADTGLGAADTDQGGHDEARGTR
jgi:hypothetical protein